MPGRLNITLYETDNEEAIITIVKQDTSPEIPQDLTAAFIDIYIKPSRDTDDGDSSVVKLSTDTGEIVKTNAASGIATVTFPNDISPGTHWWKVIVTLSGNSKTACYGTFEVANT